MRKIVFVALTFSLSFLFPSCSSGPDNAEDLEVDTMAVVADVKVKTNAQNIFNSIPDPKQLTQMITDAGLDYDPMLLNDPDKYTTYGTDDYKALNLGVYGTDLSFTSVFEQTQESMLYLKCVNQLCKGLGISDVFDEKTTDRIDANKDNRDSLLNIISQSFSKADKYLKENQRGQSSALLVAGGWVEGIYLAAKLGIDSKSPRIIEEIIKQKTSLKDLIALIEAYPSTEGTKYLVDDLRTLQTPFDNLGVAFESRDKANPLDPAMLNEVNEKINVIRKKITQN